MKIAVDAWGGDYAPVEILKGIKNAVLDDLELVVIGSKQKLSPLYKDVKEYTDLPPLLISQVEHFFQHYKDLEPGKWVKISGWESADVAKAEVLKAIEAAKK